MSWLLVDELSALGRGEVPERIRVRATEMLGKYERWLEEATNAATLGDDDDADRNSETRQP